jgi:nifR3 family TIM-barrel protein
MWYRARVKNFWNELPKPFFVQAPMDDVTDAAFRRLIARFSGPTIPRVMYSEFTTADGLLLASADGQKKLRRKLMFEGAERPIVAQLFTSFPERMEAAAAICRELDFDGLDINMGCPDRAVEKSGAGAALIRNPENARALIKAAKKGFGGPVSVKTRIGYNKDELATWLPELLAEEPAAVTVHARTRKEMSDVPARWEHVAHAVAIRDSFGSSARIIGNGDVRDLDDARAKAAETGCDGVMLGRAIFGNPWLFSDRKVAPSPQERIEALLSHITLFEELLADTTSYATMKKHYKSYLSGWRGARELRARLMETESAAEARAILELELRAE